MNWYTSNFFANYQDVKLDIIHPNLMNILIILIFFIIIVVTTKKDVSSPINLLDRMQTEQLKGLAIFFVVLGHLWVHVSKIRAGIVLSGEAVALFLLLSGFGLTMSTNRKKLNLKTFFSKRIHRVMIPYWIATVIILFLDYVILGRSLPVENILMTFAGINLGEGLRHLDYVRWFVTFILLWYLLFFLASSNFQQKHFLLCLFIAALVLLPLDYYIFHFGWYQFFAFPAGCFIAVYHKQLFRLFQEKKKVFLSASFIGIMYVLSYKLLMRQVHIYNLVINNIPNILLKFLDEGNSLIVNLAVISIVVNVAWKGYSSKLLLFLGKYSYEIFLFHGVFLIKYNPFLKGPGIFALVMGFSLLLLFTCSLSWAVAKIYQ